MKKKVKRVVVAEKEKEGKKITELLAKKISKTLQCAFKLFGQSKMNRNSIYNGNALYPWKRWKAEVDTTEEN